MKPNWEAIDQAIEVLNRAAETDGAALTNILKERWPCNDELADDQTIQVREDKSGLSVSALGLINGLFGVDENGFGHITAIFEDGRYVEFYRNDSL